MEYFPENINAKTNRAWIHFYFINFFIAVKWWILVQGTCSQIKPTFFFNSLIMKYLANKLVAE